MNTDTTSYRNKVGIILNNFFKQQIVSVHLRAIGGCHDCNGDASTTFLWEPREKVRFETGDRANECLDADTSSLAVKGRGFYGFQLTNPSAATNRNRPAAANIADGGV